MYEEPYRWIEAVGNRRQYLDDQFRQGSPLVALSYVDGIVLLTVNRGTPKLYEIYDRIAFGGMGHPADLEKLRFQLLDMAHLEGFNRSPSDVTGARLLKNGLAPTIKQAFEEIFKAPFITKILLAELGNARERDQFLSVDYDGTFLEAKGHAVIAGTPTIQSSIVEYIRGQIGDCLPSLSQAMEIGVKTWAMGDFLHQRDSNVQKNDDQNITSSEFPAESRTCTDEDILNHLRQTIPSRTLECCILDRTLPGTSKYRALSTEEVGNFLPPAVQTAG